MRFQHLSATLLALLLFSVGIVGANHYVEGLETRFIHALAPQMFNIKNQGSALQKAAFRQPDLLPIYGSSELDVADPYHGSLLFKSYPTGFTIFPVGKAGTTDLMILQDLAAVGPDLRGKKVAISLSPPWFFGGEIPAPTYAGNFSLLHASDLAFSSDLGLDVKQGAAKEMLQFPKTLQGDPVLQLALEQLASGSALNQAAYYALLPLGKLQTLVLEMQDQWESYTVIQQEMQGKRLPNADAPHVAKNLDWKALLQRAGQEQRRQASNNPFGFENQIWSKKFRALAPKQKDIRTDAQFLRAMTQSHEWTDLDLLLKGLKEMGAQPLVLSMPIQGSYYDYTGVTLKARTAAYYNRLRQVAERYDVPVVDFAGHDEDKYFLLDPGAHLSREGWIYYDQALDQFYHGATGGGRGAATFNAREILTRTQPAL